LTLNYSFGKLNYYMPCVKRFYLVIHGLVQGVNFRYSTQQKALELGLKGWVRNKKDGTVELVVEGEDKVLEEFLDWCKIGPEMARVSKIDMNQVSKLTNLTDFTIQC